MTNPKSEIKPILLSEISSIVNLEDYNKDDYIFSEKYPFSATAMIYVLQGTKNLLTKWICVHLVNLKNYLKDIDIGMILMLIIPLDTNNSSK